MTTAAHPPANTKRARDHAILTARLERSPVTDRWCAALSCALGEGADIETAIDVADEVAGKAVKLSAAHDVSGEKRDDHGRWMALAGDFNTIKGFSKASGVHPNKIADKMSELMQGDHAESKVHKGNVLYRLKGQESATMKTAKQDAAADNKAHANPNFHVTDRPDSETFNDPQQKAVEAHVEGILAKHFPGDVVRSHYTSTQFNRDTTVFWSGKKQIAHVTSGMNKDGQHVTKIANADKAGGLTVTEDDSPEYVEQTIRRVLGIKTPVALSAGLFDNDLHPRIEKGKGGGQFIKAVKAAKKASANGTLKIHTGEPIKSDVSGRTIKRHVEVGDAKVHPDELARMKVEDGEVYLGDEGLTIHEPGGKSQSPSFNHALGHVAAFKGLMDEPVIIQSAHGYSATRPRSEWAEMHEGHDPAQTFSEWHDFEGHRHTGRVVEHDGSAELASEKDSDAFFAPKASKGRGLFDPVALSQADRAGNHWVTIGAQPGEDGKKHGGSPVCINKAGEIIKGHPGLTGRKLGVRHGPTRPGDKPLGHQLGKEDISTHRQQLARGGAHLTASLAKQARKEGIHPKDLHKVAQDMMQHDAAFKKDVTSMLKETRELATSKGGTGSNVHHKNAAFEGGDYTKIHGFDVLAREMAGRYPHLLGNHGYDASDSYNANETEASEKLFDYLQAGNPTPMAAEQAYTEALDYLRSRKAEEGDHAPAPAPKRKGKPLADPESDDPIPFSQAGGTR